MAKFLIFFAFLVNLISSTQARLLSESDMLDFISQNSEKISRLKQQFKVHKGYSVIEVAKQKMIAKETPDKERDHCKNVILSALKGIGFKGIDKTKKANAGECRFAYLALYAIGINAQILNTDNLMPYAGGVPNTYTQHTERCNDIIKLAYAIRNRGTTGTNDPSNLASTLVSIINSTGNEWSKNLNANLKTYKPEDFLLEGELAQKYLYNRTGLPQIVLDFDQSVDKLLGKEFILSNVNAAGVIKEFSRLQENNVFKPYHRDLKDDKVTDTDSNYIKKVIFGFFLEDQSSALRKLFTIQYGQASLRVGVSKELKKLHIKAHPDKTSKEAFIYDNNIPTVLTSLTAIIDECKNFTVSVSDAAFTTNFLRSYQYT